MITVENITKLYGSHLVLNNLSAHFKRGEITGIIGPNACGKTTLMKCLLGLAVPNSGSVLIDGQKTTLSGEFRKTIGYMPQVPAFPGNLTANEIFVMLEELRKQDSVGRTELCDYFCVVNDLDKPIETLSGGTKQKISAIIAFMFHAPIVILDEPTVGLDPVNSIRFKNLVRKRAQTGTTVLLVSHVLSEIEQLVNRMLFLYEGQSVFYGTPHELLEKTRKSRMEEAVIRLFEGETT